MKQLLNLLLVFLMATTLSFAQKNTTPKQFAVAIQFHSVCCGVPSEIPVVKMIKSFKKKNHIKNITAYHIGPLGKEGEYDLAFQLTELNKSQRVKLISQLKKMAPKLNDKGNANILENYKFIQTSLPANVSAQKVNY